MATTTLNSGWFAANPTLPFKLVGDGNLFQLTVDVDIPGPFASGSPASGANYGGGELFKFMGKNQAFDANGHYIRFNGKDVEQATRSGRYPYGGSNENENPTTTVNNLNLPGNNEWENFQDDGDRQASDTGGHKPNTETTSGHQQDQSRGTTQTGRGGKV